MAEEIVDSYPESNINSNSTQKRNHPSEASSSEASSEGQTFTSSKIIKITSAKFSLKKVGSPTGNAHAVLYAMTGTYGNNGKPTGSPLATSDNFDVSTLTTSLQLIIFTFTGAQQYEMSASFYCIQIENPETGTIDDSNYLAVGWDSSSPSHDGNRCNWWNGAWSSNSSIDTCFYVYGEVAAVGFTRKIKISGTFQDKPIKEKKAGTFVDKPIKIKVGGTFQDA